jgi:hypothetical protein
VGSRNSKRKQKPLRITKGLDSWPSRINQWYDRQLLQIELLFQNKDKNYLFNTKKKSFVRKQVRNYLQLTR